MIEIVDSKPVSGNPAARVCCKCGRQLETTEFFRSKRDGLQYMCVWCGNQYAREYRLERYHSDAVFRAKDNAKSRAYHQTSKWKEYHKAYMKAYRERKKQERMVNHGKQE